MLWNAESNAFRCQWHANRVAKAILRTGKKYRFRLALHGNYCIFAEE